MYEIALSVGACVRAGTRADVALLIDPALTSDAVAFTPGGGRLGVLGSGAFDGFLADEAERQRDEGRVVSHSVSAIESEVSGLAPDRQIRFLLVPGSQFPDDLWARLIGREQVLLGFRCEGDVIRDVATLDEQDWPESSDRALASGIAVASRGEEILLWLAPIRRLVVAGRGPIADALMRQAEVLGWRAVCEARPDAIRGLAATLAGNDAIVVLGHDVEASSQCLQAALESDAGYIGAVGSSRMQEARAAWLAYRDVVDLSRVHGPAGLAIGASSPPEIAVSITAEILAEASA